MLGAAPPAPTFDVDEANELVDAFVMLIWGHLFPLITMIFISLLILKIIKAVSSV
ncbi:hypothetical protein [Phormidium nigroviride]